MRLGVLGMLLQTSAILYENYVPYAKIRAVLGALALLNFVSFEKSLKREGARVGRTAAAAAIKSLGLSVFAGIAAPVIETASRMTRSLTFGFVNPTLDHNSQIGGFVLREPRASTR